MASRILFNNGEEIDQAISGAYPNIITRGSGFVRDTGIQIISGEKYFYDRITFYSGAYVSGDLAVTGNIVGHLPPKTDNLYDLGSSVLEWRDLYVDGIARIDNLHVDETANITGVVNCYSNINVVGNSAVTGSSTVLGDFIPTILAANFIPKTDNLYDLGSSSLEFKNLFIDGTGRIDSLHVDEVANFSGDIFGHSNLNVAGNAVVTGNSRTNGSATVSLGLSVGAGLTVTGESVSTSYSQASSFRTSGSGQFGTLFVTGGEVPTSATGLGVQGQIVLDFTSGYLYACTGTNRWGRTHLTGWT